MYAGIRTFRSTSAGVRGAGECDTSRNKAMSFSRAKRSQNWRNGFGGSWGARGGVIRPYAEKNYYAMRPTLAIPAPHVLGEGDASTMALDLDGFFGLHPALAPLQSMFQKEQL